MGREIAAEAGRALKRVSLELGGKAPSIITADADVDAIEAYTEVKSIWTRL